MVHGWCKGTLDSGHQLLCVKNGNSFYFKLG